MKGRYVGTETHDGTYLDVYQFADCLVDTQESEQRILDILVPTEGKSWSNGAFVRESSVLCAQVNDAAINISGRGYARGISPDALDKLFPPSVYGCTLVLVGIRPDHWELSVLRDSKEGPSLQWKHYRAKDEIEWQVRSRSKYVLMHLHYLYTVPLDIVTLPVQFFLLPAMTSLP